MHHQTACVTATMHHEYQALQLPCVFVSSFTDKESEVQTISTTHATPLSLLQQELETV